MTSQLWDIVFTKNILWSSKASVFYNNEYKEVTKVLKSGKIKIDWVNRFLFFQHSFFEHLLIYINMIFF